MNWKRDWLRGDIGLNNTERTNNERVMSLQQAINSICGTVSGPGLDASKRMVETTDKLIKLPIDQKSSVLMLACGRMLARAFHDPEFATKLSALLEVEIAYVNERDQRPAQPVVDRVACAGEGEI